jgi:hypothetical protein
MNSQLIRQNLNWLIIDHMSRDDMNTIRDCINTVTEEDWSSHTSAKGENSKQHYIINPSWMPSNVHNEPENWHEAKQIITQKVQNEIIFHSVMPGNWEKLHACSAWTVKGDEGSFHTIHDHGPLNVSSVLYLEVPKSDSPTAGNIYFVMHGEPYNALATPSFRVMHVDPKPGMIIIFPSWLLHGVYPQGPGLRQTVNVDFNGDPNYKFNIPHSGGASYRYIP